jgi:hypothetical protein
LVVLWTFLLVKDHAIPVQKVPCRWFAEIPFLGQPIMRCPAVAIEAVVGEADHLDEAVILKLAKPSSHVVPMAVRAEFLDRCAAGQIDGVLELGVVPLSERQVERAGPVR